MGCNGPDPPEHNPHDLSPPPRHDVMINGAFEESDEEQDHFGYEPLPQAPDAVHSDHDSEEELEATEAEQAAPHDVSPIEPMEAVLTREVWNSPRPTDPIQMDTERAQQVMSAMANFALPQTSIPDWAKSISEDQWKQTLQNTIEKIKGNSIN